MHYTTKCVTKILLSEHKAQLSMFNGRHHYGTENNMRHAFTHLTYFIYIMEL